MLCDKCGKRQATTYVKKTVNGHTEEWHLCGRCAQQENMDSLFNGFFDLGNFWGSLFSEPSVRELADTVQCPTCKKSFREIVEAGKVGCPDCYITYYDRLLPSIQRIHGKTQHVGKRPNAPVVCDETPEAPADELADLKKQLEEKISAQQYEECARLRDRIKHLEDEEKEKGESGNE